MALEAGDLPLHRQLFVTLRDRIESGAYDVGARLPSEQALCREYGVSRITVRRALRDLTDDGYLERRHGLGTYVSRRPVTASPRLSVMEALRQTQASTTVTVLELDRRTPPRAIADALDLPAGEEAVHALRVRNRARTPLLVTDAWMPATLAAGVVTRERLAREALYEILQGAGVTFGRIVQEISAELADPVRARLLRVGIGSPLLRIERLVHDDADRPVQHLTITASPDRTRILTEYAAQDIDTVASGILAHRATRRVARGS